MRQLNRSIDIDADVATVWDVVTDLPRYGDWNPFLVAAEGRFAAGERLRLTMRPGSRTMTFTPMVLDAEPGRSVRWLGRLGLPGIFDGEHVLEVAPLPGGRTRFTQRERFRGILVPFVASTLRDTDRAFVAMNEALKVRAEVSVAAAGPDAAR